MMYDNQFENLSGGGYETYNLCPCESNGCTHACSASTGNCFRGCGNACVLTCSNNCSWTLAFIII